MLHHVPSAALQNCVLKEALRVLRPSGTFAGVDSLDAFLFRSAVFIWRDTMVLVDPATFPGGLHWPDLKPSV